MTQYFSDIQKQSYFTYFDTPLLHLHTGPKHIHYFERPDFRHETTDETYYVPRQMFLNKLNGWLEQPVIGRYGFILDSRTDTNMNEDSDGYEVENEENDNIETNKITYKNALKNISLVKDFHDKITTLIEENGYTIEDKNQFKEDFIYLMYSLSRIPTKDEFSTQQ